MNSGQSFRINNGNVTKFSVSDTQIDAHGLPIINVSSSTDPSSAVRLS